MSKHINCSSCEFQLFIIIQQILSHGTDREGFVVEEKINKLRIENSLGDSMSDQIQFVETAAIDGIKTLVIGLPEIGLVGTISAMQMIKSLEMEEIGYIKSDLFPPLIIFHDATPKAPVRLFKKDSIALLVSEIPLPLEALNAFVEDLVEWIKTQNVELTVIIGAVPLPNRQQLSYEDLTVFGIPIGKYAEERITPQNLPTFNDGIIAGPLAKLLWRLIEEQIPTISLYATAFERYPDPGAAIAVLNVLSKLLDQEINIQELIEKADEIRLRLRDLAHSTDQTMVEMGKSAERSLPALYS